MTVSTRSMAPADRIIVALDVRVDDAFNLVRHLDGQVRAFKLGYGSAFDESVSSARELASFIVDCGNTLMLDFKIFDTRDTVKRMMEIVAKLGAPMVTVHKDCTGYAAGYGPKVLAVGALTDGTGNYQTITDLNRADGLVCSALGAYAARANFGPGCVIVCPGIRPAGTAIDNHIRPNTPREAIEAGADYIVVGRPIYAAGDPVEAVRSITREIEDALSNAALPRLSK